MQSQIKPRLLFGKTIFFHAYNIEMQNMNTINNTVSDS